MQRDRPRSTGTTNREAKTASADASSSASTTTTGNGQPDPAGDRDHVARGAARTAPGCTPAMQAKRVGRREDDRDGEPTGPADQRRPGRPRPPSRRSAYVALSTTRPAATDEVGHDQPQADPQRQEQGHEQRRPAERQRTGRAGPGRSPRSATTATTTNRVTASDAERLVAARGRRRWPPRTTSGAIRRVGRAKGGCRRGGVGPPGGGDPAARGSGGGPARAEIGSASADPGGRGCGGAQDGPTGDGSVGASGGAPGDGAVERGGQPDGWGRQDGRGHRRSSGRDRGSGSGVGVAAWAADGSGADGARRRGAGAGGRHRGGRVGTRCDSEVGRREAAERRLRREADHHPAAVGFALLGADLAAVEVDDPPGDGEAEPGAAAIVGPGLIGAVEALEDPGGLLRRRCPGRGRRPRSRRDRRRRDPRRRPARRAASSGPRSRAGWRRPGGPARGRRRPRARRRPAPGRRGRGGGAGSRWRPARAATRRRTGGCAAATRPTRAGRGRAAATTMRPRRSVWASIVRSTSGSAGSTPSTMFSRCACSAEIGVRSSWETLATRSRRMRSVSSSSAAMALNAAASRPTSSCDVTSTRWL